LPGVGLWGDEDPFPFLVHFLVPLRFGALFSFFPLFDILLMLFTVLLTALFCFKMGSYKNKKATKLFLFIKKKAFVALHRDTLLNYLLLSSSDDY